MACSEKTVIDPNARVRPRLRKPGFDLQAPQSVTDRVLSPVSEPCACHDVGMDALTRRDFLRFASLSGFGFSSIRASTQTRFSSDPFALGVASGDPSSDGFVLWTRLIPEPAAATGTGLPAGPIGVEWIVARDQNLTRIVQSGRSFAVPELAHSVHIEVAGLEPDREYWYAFRVEDAQSTIGRTRTAPAIGSRPDRLNFAFASCANYTHGHYTAYRALAEEDLDLVVFLGDYIYEGGSDAALERSIGAKVIRSHTGTTCRTLEDYRVRYALYKSDPNLQLAHARAPWVVTWDDHELEDNYANDLSRHGTSKEELARRRLAAYQAYYEHQPLRLSALPRGLQMQLYRRITYGDLAEFSILDTRQFRTPQPCGDFTLQIGCNPQNPNETMLGHKQESWLQSGLERSGARWNLLAQQVMMAKFDPLVGPGIGMNNDGWDGYPLARGRMLNFLEAGRTSNPIVLTGDIHSSFVADLKCDFLNPNSRTLATEFVGTSITSVFPEIAIGLAQAAMADNPHLKYFDAEHRGYSRVQLSRNTLRTDYRVINTLEFSAKVRTASSWVVVDGQAGAQRA
jgi:alkaline phosphatase D